MSFRMQKYKVFINDKWIFFGEFLGDQSAENEEYDVLNCNEQLVSNMAKRIKAGNFDRNIVLNQSVNIDQSFDFFLKQFLVLEAAGGIVRHSDEKYLMIKRFGVWDFPKGKIEKNESKATAALREVEEETGVKNLQISRELPALNHIYRYGHQWIVKRTYWFLMHSDFDGHLKPQKEEDILEAIWIPENQLCDYLENAYASLKELVKESAII